MSLFLQSVGFGVVTAAIIVIAAVGLTLQFSVTNYINFAYGTILTFSIYMTGTFLGIFGRGGFWLAAVGGVIAAMLLSLGIGIFLDRWFVRRGSSQLLILIATVGVFMVVEYGVEAVWGPNNLSLPLPPEVAQKIGPFLLTVQDLYIIGAALVVAIGTHLLLRHTRMGQYMRAVSDNSGLATGSGINVRRLIYATWVISGGLGGVAGIALAVDTATYSPSSTDSYLFLFFAAVVVGGVGDVYGAMFGGLLLGVLTEVSPIFIGSAFKYTVALAALILVMLLRPRGIFGTGRLRVG